MELIRARFLRVNFKFSFENPQPTCGIAVYLVVHTHEIASRGKQFSLNLAFG